MPDNYWQEIHSDFMIDTVAFKKGILSVAPRESSLQQEVTDAPLLKFGTQAFKNVMTPKAAGKPKQQVQILNSLVKGSDWKIEEGKYLRPANQRDEIYHTVINADNEETYTLHVSSSATAETNIKIWHMAGCMFGGYLQGKDKNGCSFPLVKHDIEFWKEQTIIKISPLPVELHPYETMLFTETRHLTHLITAFSDPSSSPKVVYHLPAYDYIIAGILLFLQKRMTFAALQDYIWKVFLRAQLHAQTLNTIFVEARIDCEFVSPFLNLFGHYSEYFNLINTENLPKEALTEKILAHLNYSSDMTEENMFGKLMQLLSSASNYNRYYQEVWLTLLSSQENLNEHQLFTIGNMILPVATAREKNSSIGSLLSLSEKPIHTNLIRKLKTTLKGFIPPPLLITYLQPLNLNGESLFYLDKEHVISQILTSKLIDTLISNSYMVTIGKKPCSWEDFLLQQDVEKFKKGIEIGFTFSGVIPPSFLATITTIMSSLIKTLEGNQNTTTTFENSLRQSNIREWITYSHFAIPHDLAAPLSCGQQSNSIIGSKPRRL